MCQQLTNANKLSNSLFCLQAGESGLRLNGDLLVRKRDGRKFKVSENAAESDTRQSNGALWCSDELLTTVNVFLLKADESEVPEVDTDESDCGKVEIGHENSASVTENLGLESAALSLSDGEGRNRHPKSADATQHVRGEHKRKVQSEQSSDAQFATASLTSGKKAPSHQSSRLETVSSVSGQIISQRIQERDTQPDLSHQESLCRIQNFPTGGLSDHLHPRRECHHGPRDAPEFQANLLSTDTPRNISLGTHNEPEVANDGKKVRVAEGVGAELNSAFVEQPPWEEDAPTMRSDTHVRHNPYRWERGVNDSLNWKHVPEVIIHGLPKLVSQRIMNLLRFYFEKFTIFCLHRASLSGLLICISSEVSCDKHRALCFQAERGCKPERLCGVMSVLLSLSLSSGGPPS